VREYHCYKYRDQRHDSEVQSTGPERMSGVPVVTRDFEHGSILSGDPFQASADPWGETPHDEIHRFLWRIGHVTKPDFIAGEYACLHHLLTPLPESPPKT
jgi:hypothetical protein